MNWVNIRTEILRAPAYVASEPTARATWFNVLVYCAEQENGGRILDARSWKCRQWQQTCGVTLEEVESAGRLLKWEGDDLVVWNYPCEKQAHVQKMRALGACGGASRSAKKREASAINGHGGGRPAEPELRLEDNPSENLSENPSGNPSADPQITQAKTQRNGMEEEGNRNGNNTPLPPASGGMDRGRKKDEGEKLLPTTENSKRIATLFRRRHDTGWSAKEVKAYKAIGAMDADDLTLIESYYAEQRSLGDEGVHRRDLGTFLNNFHGELDRARQWRDQQNKPKTNALKPNSNASRPHSSNPRVTETLNRAGRYAGVGNKGVHGAVSPEIPGGVSASGTDPTGHADSNGAIHG